MKQYIAKVRLKEDLVFFGRTILKKDQIIEVSIKKKTRKNKKAARGNIFFYTKNNKTMPINTNEVEVIEVNRI